MGLIDSILSELNIIESVGGIETVEVADTKKLKEMSEAESERKKTLEAIFEKNYICPVCDQKFTNLTIRSGKIRIKDIDMDLKPTYEPFHGEYYDIVMCPHCGYAALTSKFSTLMDFQIDLLIKNIKSNFEPVKFDDIYTREDALLRYKQAMQCNIVKRARASEIAYTALKMAWIYRDLKEDLYETRYLKLAYDGFNKAISNEYYPMCGLGEHTVLYILSNLAYKLGNKDRAKKILGGIMGRRNIQPNLKRKIEDFRELLK